MQSLYTVASFGALLAGNAVTRVALAIPRAALAIARAAFAAAANAR